MTDRLFAGALTPRPAGSTYVTPFLLVRVHLSSPTATLVLLGYGLAESPGRCSAAGHWVPFMPPVR
jgi:predicted MFS family arabinose efflux permease